MGELNNIVKTFAAYLVRPQLYPELGRKIYKNVFQRKAAFKGKESALKWCEQIAVSQEDAIFELFNIKSEPVAELFPEIFENAQIKERECPVKMGGAGALELIYYACEFTKAQNVIETGVAYGWSSLAVLLSLKKRNGTLYSSDMPYLAQNGDKYVGCVVSEDVRKNWKLYRYADRESLPKIFAENASFDVLHYDSDKSYNGRIWAYNEIYKHIRKGGIFISDDVGDNSAFQDFCKKNKISPVIIAFEGKYVGIFIKS
jgi:predicted O-methyltransferase YrrM